MNALWNSSFDADEFAVHGENNVLPRDSADLTQDQESSSQEEEDEPEASYDDEEIKGAKSSQDDFWLTTPPFIARTYEMISSCKPEVACWSDDGEMFIVKDQTVLSRMYIPQYFGHCNFSSFDRQLNLYGFRKKFSDIFCQVDISDFQTDNSKEISKYVRFHHRHFKRGRTDLLHLIKRAKIKKSSSSQKKRSSKRKIVEVQELKEELSSLESHLTSVVSEMEQKFVQLSKDIDRKFDEMQRIVSDTSNRLLQTQEQFEVERYLHSLFDEDVDLDGQTLSEELRPLNLNFQHTTSTSELSHEMNSEIVSLLHEIQPTLWQAGLDTTDQEAYVPDSCL